MHTSAATEGIVLDIVPFINSNSFIESLRCFISRRSCPSHIISDCGRNFLSSQKQSRSSHRRCYLRKGFLRNFAKFTGKHLCQSLFFNKVAGLRPATVLKKRLWRTCFLVNFAKFLRTFFLRNTSGRLLSANIVTMAWGFFWVPCKEYQRAITQRAKNIKTNL